MDVYQMEIKWIEDFLCLADIGSFSKCAQRRNVTQPAFSRRIKALEEWIGASLINRASYPVTLTPEGEEFKKVAENIIEQLQTTRDLFQQKWRTGTPDISFASLDSLSTSFFPVWLKQLEMDGSVPATQLLQNSLKECVTFLEQDNCDFVLCYGHSYAETPMDNTDYLSTTLAIENLIPVCLSDPYGNPSIHPSQTPKTPLKILAYSSDCFLGQVTETVLNKVSKDHSLEIVYQNSTATSLKSMVEQGYGIAWIPERLVKKELDKGEMCIIQEFNWVPHLDIKLYRSKREKREIVEQFWKMISGNARSAVKFNKAVIKRAANM